MHKCQIWGVYSKPALYDWVESGFFFLESREWSHLPTSLFLSYQISLAFRKLQKRCVCESLTQWILLECLYITFHPVGK